VLFRVTAAPPAASVRRSAAVILSTAISMRFLPARTPRDGAVARPVRTSSLPGRLSGVLLGGWARSLM
jgi:hypothetical protein